MFFTVVGAAGFDNGGGGRAGDDADGPAKNSRSALIR